MNRSGILRVLFLGMVLVTLGLSTQFAFAGAHGGGGGGFHGGGGGFHGGGGGFHGGGGYGGYHGGWGGGYRGGWGGYGYRGGWGGYGWRGGYGWGGYGWGWGFGIGLNFGWPYWGWGYPYSYGYAPYYGYYPYPYYPYAPTVASPGYADPADYSQANTDSQNYQNDVPVSQPRPSVRQPAPNSNSLNLSKASYRPPASYKAASATMSAVSYRPAAAEHRLPSMRPQVGNIIRALRGMPPEARQRQIDSGRYSSLSPEELKLVKYATEMPR